MLSIEELEKYHEEYIWLYYFESDIKVKVIDKYEERSTLQKAANAVPKLNKTEIN